MIEDTVQALLDSTETELEDFSEGGCQVLDRVALLDLEELVALQDAQATLYAQGLISVDIATWCYQAYGGEHPSPDRFASLSLAKRVVAVMLGKRLLEMWMRPSV